MKVTMLGTGTSEGIPSIGCDCRVCLDAADENSRNRRRRCSVLLKYNGVNVLIDTSPDLYEQARRNRFDLLDAVLFTHHHFDHIGGLNDIRAFNFNRRRQHRNLGIKEEPEPIDCYGPKDTLDAIKQIFYYMFDPRTQKGGGLPSIRLNPVDSEFELFEKKIIPIPALHGKQEVYGYRIDDFAYVTDTNFIPEQSKELLKGLDVLVLDGLRYKEHPTHFNLAQAIEAARELKAKKTYFTHMTHMVDHRDLFLPDGMELAYDGLEFNL